MKIIICFLFLLSPSLIFCQENKNIVKARSKPIEMVYVQGGTFQMGSSNIERDDKVSISINVNDSTVAEFIMSEAQFKEKKFNIPLNIKGDSLLVNALADITLPKFIDSTLQIVFNERKLSVKVTQPVLVSDYYIGKYEVTQAQWKAVMKKNNSTFKGDNLPVETVSWYDVQEFLSKLNKQTGKKYRLPTEAEWEYAARGGNKSLGYQYAGSQTLGDVAWYKDNSKGTTHDVGTKLPNEIGLFDMCGNVWEWCNDWYGAYSKSALINPKGPKSGEFRVYRGGGFTLDPILCRLGFREYSGIYSRDYQFGFRLCLSKQDQ